MSVGFNQASINALVGLAPEMMIYGFEHCKYRALQDCFERGKINLLSHRSSTLDGRSFKIIPVESGKNMRVWKNNIVSLVWENFLREQEGKEIIPLIFCLDIDDSPHNKTQKELIENITSIVAVNKEKTTHKELRRIYKLCFDLAVDPRIQEVAKRTIQFVKITKENTEYCVKKIEAPWVNLDEWKIYWDVRIGIQRRVVLKQSKETQYQWRYQLSQWLRTHDDEKKGVDEFYSLKTCWVLRCSFTGSYIHINKATGKHSQIEETEFNFYKNLAMSISKIAS